MGSGDRQRWEGEKLTGILWSVYEGHGRMWGIGDQNFGRFLEILIFMGAFLSFFFHTNFYSKHHTKSIIIAVVYKNSFNSYTNRTDLL